MHDDDDLQYEQSINSTINKGLTVLNTTFGQNGNIRTGNGETCDNVIGLNRHYKGRMECNIRQLVNSNNVPNRNSTWTTGKILGPVLYRVTKSVKFDTNVNNRNNNIQIGNIREAFKSSIIRLCIVSEEFSFVEYEVFPFFTKCTLNAFVRIVLSRTTFHFNRYYRQSTNHP